jgi:hypothetical protein
MSIFSFISKTGAAYKSSVDRPALAVMFWAKHGVVNAIPAKAALSISWQSPYFNKKHKRSLDSFLHNV